MIKELNESNFEENIKTGLKLVVFSAPWCGYCKRQHPILEELSENKQSPMWVGEVNGDASPSLVAKYNIEAFPAFVLFKEGKPVGQFMGYREKSDLLRTVMNYVNP